MVKQRRLDALQPLVRSSIRVWRSRARERHWRTCSGGIHASGNRPSASSLRSQRASSRSVLARRLRPRNARVSTGLGEMRDGAGPRARHTRTANPCTPPPRHRSVAREAPGPARHRLRRRRDPATRHLARIGVERVEGDLRSMHVKPGYDRHRGLLYSSGICHLARVSRAERRRPEFMPSPRRGCREGAREIRSVLAEVHSRAALDDGRNGRPARDRRDGGSRKPTLGERSRGLAGGFPDTTAGNGAAERMACPETALPRPQRVASSVFATPAWCPGSGDRPSADRQTTRRSPRRASDSTSRIRDRRIVQSSARGSGGHTLGITRGISEDGVDGPGGGRSLIGEDPRGEEPRRGGPFADRYAGSSLSTRRWAESMPACGGRVRPRSARRRRRGDPPCTEAGRSGPAAPSGSRG